MKIEGHILSGDIKSLVERFPEDWRSTASDRVLPLLSEETLDWVMGASPSEQEALLEDMVLAVLFLVSHERNIEELNFSEAELEDWVGRFRTAILLEGTSRSTELARSTSTQISVFSDAWDEVHWKIHGETQ